MGKASKRGTAKKSTSPSTSSAPPKDDQQEIPTEFTQVPSSLQKFVEPLSRKHVYLLHLDTQPRAIKRQIFVFPLFLNVLITAIILYRAYAGYFTYPEIFLALIGEPSPVAIDTSTASTAQIAKVIVQRALTFLIDYLLVTLFLPWPVRFCTGPLNWRRKLGFQNVEVIVRKSREWSEELGEPREWIRGQGSGDKATVIKDRILPVMTPMHIRNKTGFLMIDANWDLDFAAMICAHGLIDARRGEGKRREHFEPFTPSVLVYGGDDSGWLVWRLEREDEDNENPAATEPDLSPSQRDKILTFKNKLTNMGKEDLFFRWVELVQYESTQPGGFTPERQRKTMEQVQALFEGEGVDFEEFWADVGGMEGVSL